ncbi:MAG: putative baseplate assembly protein, partial [Chloroflexi bacterium]
MTDFAPNLDDLRFQKDLVDEARRRIIQYCPEWTDYNLSDPGITLIELFAYMTEMQVYRLNRVPERNYLKFLEMMGFQPLPASSARAELTFYLSAPLPISPEDDLIIAVPKGLEVTSRPNEEETPVTFTVDERLVLESPKMTQVRKQTDIVKNYLQRMGIEPFYAFDQYRPKIGDTFYIGFDEAHDIRGNILRLTFECEQTQAVGIRRDDPPWVWECSTGEGRWQKIVPSTRTGERDSTGGLNNENGSIVFYLPLSANPDQIHGKNAYWLRCRIEQRSPEQGMYSESPKVIRIEAHTLGGTTWATHATIEQGELLGNSSGEPGQVFHLRHAPILAFEESETVEVEERNGSELFYRSWTRVDDFSKSDRYDRHFTLDESTGVIRFGPGVRQPDGSICQYGRVPEAGRKVRLTQYRYGGGVAGNVPAGKIQVMRSAVPYIDKVTNFKRA